VQGESGAVRHSPSSDATADATDDGICWTVVGDTLDTDRIQASYHAGVLPLRIPLAETANAHKIEITNADGDRGEIIA